MTPFAAGCALCGADLEAWRRSASASRVRRPSVPVLRPIAATETGGDAALVGVLVLLALVAPIFCFLLAAIAARDRHLRGRLLARNVIVGVGAAAAVLLLIPSVRFGLFQLLL